ncbi:MAG: CDP-alcohol phosphatidyltransferase family protein [SAR202 cluster bacterium]|nr:CDP-alcohol phosphatidyltransferase family protein [SAR202 cluster bacterium]
MNRATTRKVISSYFEQPAAKLLKGLGVSPNTVTLAGLLVAGGAAWLVLVGYLLAGGVVLAVSGLFDLLDGALARATGKASRFGALLDSVSDRVGEGALLLGVLLYYAFQPHTVGVALSFVAMGGSFMVSYLRARAEGLGIECKAGFMTRPERVATLAAALVVAQWWEPMLAIALGIIAALTLFTSAQRLLIIWRELKRLGG